MYTARMTPHYACIGFVVIKIVAWFAEKLRVLAHNVKSILSANVPMEFTRDNLEKFNNAVHCHICEKPFAPNDTRSLSFDRAIQRFRAFKL